MELWTGTRTPWANAASEAHASLWNQSLWEGSGLTFLPCPPVTGSAAHGGPALRAHTAPDGRPRLTQAG